MLGRVLMMLFLWRPMLAVPRQEFCEFLVPLNRRIRANGLECRDHDGHGFTSNRVWHGHFSGYHAVLGHVAGCQFLFGKVDLDEGLAMNAQLRAMWTWRQCDEVMVDVLYRVVRDMRSERFCTPGVFVAFRLVALPREVAVFSDGVE